jgi:hypothetical protein
MHCVEKRYIQPSEGAPLTGYDANRYNVQVLKFPEKSTHNREQIQSNVEEVEVA